MLDYVYMTKEIYKTFNIVYKREYFSDEDSEWFWIGYSMYKNVPIEKIKYYRKQLLNFKKIMDSQYKDCLLYTSPSPRDTRESRMPASA